MPGQLPKEGSPLFKRRNPNGTEADLPAEQPGTEAPILPAAAQAKPDTGLGVPPYRPAQPKEAPAMARTPFSTPTPITPPAPPTPTMPGPGAMPGGPMSQPFQGAARPNPGRPAPREGADRRTLVVGRGISVQGTVQDAERLVVEGTVEASMIHATELSISPGGVFKGEVEVEDAEVAGTIDGTLTARGNLIIRATGRVLGTARCRRLQVEDGGQITGRMEMLTEAARPVDVAAAS